MLLLLLELVAAVIVLGIVVVLVAVPQRSPIISILVKTDYYIGYHIALTFFSNFLGEYGFTLRDKSLAFMMESVQDIYVPAVNEHKKKLFAGLTALTSSSGAVSGTVTQRGDKRPVVLEIGIGSGCNFKYYPKECDLLIVEPNGEFEALYKKSLEQFKGIRLVGEYRSGAEDMSGIKDKSVDAVVTTLVLCNFSDVNKALQEIQRVLKPGGKYYLLDHVKTHDPNEFPGIGQRILGTLMKLAQFGHGHGHGGGHGHSHGGGHGHSHGDGHGQSHGDGHGHSHGQGRRHGGGSGCGGEDVESKLKLAGFSHINESHVKLTFSRRSMACERMANHRLVIATK